MFENILHQGVTGSLKEDIAASSLAPALLFAGPPWAGKGTAALELARALSCENKTGGGPSGRFTRAPWNCGCPSCVRHRFLASQDFLLMGKKSFYPEIAASAAAFSREQGRGTKMLFSRSLRKLLVRFSPVLWEGDPKLGKIGDLTAGLEEDLEEFESRDFSGGENQRKLEGLRASLVKQAIRLAAEGTGELLPITRLRRAAYWSRLAPLGKHKCIIIENAEYMKEEAKNSLLKILEEPPQRVTIILTSSQPKGLLPTMLSRLRLYSFVQRGPEEEAEVLRRIFKKDDAEGPAGIGAYLESFLPVSGAAFYPLGAYFAASLAAAAGRMLRGEKRPLPRTLVELGKFAAPIAEQGGFGRPAPDMKTALAGVLKTADNFEISGLFAKFCAALLKLLSAWLRDGAGYPEKTRMAALWKEKLSRAFSSADLYNIGTALVLESLGEDLKLTMTEDR